MKYFGKRYLHNFLKEKKFSPPALKEMEYGKYRGDEWLRCDTLDAFCTYGKMIHVSVLEYDEKKDKHVETERYGFDLANDKWYKTYERKNNEILIARQLTFDDLVYEGGEE